MHINRGLLFWGLALITAGAVALATMQGLIDREALTGAWRLWPVVLIAIGLSVVLSRTPFAAVGTIVAALVVGIAGGAVLSGGPGFVNCSERPESFETSGGDFTLPEATVHLELNCGDLEVGMTEGTGWEAVTGVTENPLELESAAGSLDIRSDSGGFPFGRDGQDWTLSLGADVTYDLSANLNSSDNTLDLAGGTFTRLAIDPNTGSLNMDLSGSEVQDLRVQLNAGSLSLVTDGDTDLSGQINVNAGSVDFCAPADAGVRLVVNGSVAFAHDLDESDLTQSGDTFTSPGFASAEHKIDLQLQGNAASFELNPEGGCE
jgi:hypothetical protein